MKKMVAVFILLPFILTGLILFSSNPKQKTPRPKADKIININKEVNEPTPTNTSVNYPQSKKINLNITSIQNGEVVKESSVQIKGKTIANGYVFVNDNELLADNQGNFSTSITLEEGENPIVVVAGDEEGNYAESELTIIYEPGETF